MHKVMFNCLLFLLGILLTGCGTGSQAVNLYTTKNSPIVYNSELYFYSEDETMEYANQSKDTIKLKTGGGLLDNIEKKEISYDIKDNDKSILVSNNNNLLCNYMSQSKIENEERIEKILEKYDDYLIEKQEIEFSGSGGDVIKPAEMVGISTLDKSVVEELEKKFGKVEYRIGELKNIREIYLVKVGCVDYNSFLKKYFDNRAFEVGDFYDTEMPEILIGIILEKDGSYFYGNFDNKISEELVKKIGL